MPQTKSQSKSESQGDSQSDKETLASIHQLLKNMDKRFNKRLDSLESRFIEAVDELKGEFGVLKDELKEENKEMKSRIDGLEDSLEFHVNKSEEFEKKQEKTLMDIELKLLSRVNCLEESLLYHEKNSRKYNLLLYGIPRPSPAQDSGQATAQSPAPPQSQTHEGDPQVKETVKETPTENIYRTIKTFLIDDCHMEEKRVNAIRYHHAHRLPKKTGKTGPEPIIVRFVFYQDRDEVFQSGFHLPRGKRILSDLPVTMKKERSRLATEAYNIRQKEKLQTRILESGLDLILQTRTNKTDKWRPRLV